MTALIEVSPITDDDQAIATSVAVFPSSFSGQLCSDDEQPFGIFADWYSVDAFAGDTIEASFTEDIPGGVVCDANDLFVQIYDASLNLVTGGSSDGFGCGVATARNVAAGTYFVIVLGQPGVAHSQPYALNIDVDQPTCGNGTLEAGEDCDDNNIDPGDGCASDCRYECVDDAYEDNDDFASPYVVDDAASVTLDGMLCPGDTDGAFATGSDQAYDTFQVPFTGGQTVRASILPGPSTTCDDLEINIGFYDPNVFDPNASAFITGRSSSTGECPVIHIVAAFDAYAYLIVYSESETPEDYQLVIEKEVATCGNGIEELAETCDDGNTDGGDGCSEICSVERCGNGNIEPGNGEWCDDGNNDDGDGCDSTCQLEATPCADADGDGFADEACGGTDCRDDLIDVNPNATEIPGDGLDNDCVNGDEPAVYEVCAVEGPRTNGAAGVVTCGDTAGEMQWDVYEVMVSEGDCVDVMADNGAGAADLLAYVEDDSGRFFGLQPDYSQLDDEATCSVTPWDGFACPARSLTASAATPMRIGVAQWAGGCADNAEYVLHVAVNGVEVAPTQIADDVAR